MPAVIAWLAKPFLHVPRWHWLVAAVIVVVVWLLAGWSWGVFMALGHGSNVLGARQRRAERIEIDARAAAEQARTTRVAEAADARGEVLRSAARSEIERVDALPPDDLARELEDTRRRR